MAPSKTYKDYASFDAYVDGILMKRSSGEGMFAVWNQQSADAESLIPLLRRYADRLEKEKCTSEALPEKIIMKEAPGSEDFMQCRDAAKAALEKLSPNQLNGLLRKAQEGHGGKLLESFSELTGVNAANWRDQAWEPDAREAGEELRGLSL